VIDPMTAYVNDERCSGCRTCIPVCPYKAIEYDTDKAVAAVNGALCAGCGTCVAACPTGAMQGRHFTEAAIVAEIEAVLAS
jgi:heterodisulfide reductase subunit A